MALIRRKNPSSVAASDTDVHPAAKRSSPSRAHITSGAGKRQSHRGYAFNQTDEPAGMQTKMIRADRTKKDKKNKPEKISK